MDKPVSCAMSGLSPEKSLTGLGKELGVAMYADPWSALDAEIVKRAGFDRCRYMRRGLRVSLSSLFDHLTDSIFGNLFRETGLPKMENSLGGTRGERE